jgi:recombination protein RecA
LAIASSHAVPAISTGSLSLDIALGIGGLPKAVLSRSMARNHPVRRRWPCRSSPKRSVSGGTCAFIDAEHALDPIYAESLGRQYRRPAGFSQPDTGEQALEICDMIVRSGAVDVVVIDSVAALTPKRGNRR